MPLLARLRRLFDLDVEPLAIVLARVKILPIDDEQALRAGDILADLVSDLVVVTRNVKHLGRIRGLSVENWWDSSECRGDTASASLAPKLS